MRTLICSILKVTIALMVQFSSLFALNTPELYIRNESINRNIFVTIYPISFLFNGFNNYDLLARYREDTVYNFINSRVNDRLDHGQSIILNHDYNGATSGNAGAVGFGVYKFEFNGINNFTFFDTLCRCWS